MEKLYGVGREESINYRNYISVDVRRRRILSGIELSKKLSFLEKNWRGLDLRDSSGVEWEGIYDRLFGGKIFDDLDLS